MDYKATELWRSLAAMQVEPADAQMSFPRRLASENGWALDYADRVFEEYRRFLYLAVTEPGPVTPSDAVDQAWHLHLAYSQHYWDELCGKILERPLHHGPTMGGQVEGERYARQYRSTIDAYRRVFEADPASDIWPPVSVRFAVRARRVDLSRNIVIPRPSVGTAIIVTSAVLLVGCTQRAIGFDAAVPIFFVLIVLLIVYAARKSGAANRNGKDGGSSCGSSDAGSNDSGCGGGCGD